MAKKVFLEITQKPKQLAP